MIRIIALLIAITLLSSAAAWLEAEPGHVAIDWSDYHVDMSLLVALAAVSLLSLACVIVYLVSLAIVRSPRSWLRSRASKRQMLGLTALTEAFSALATHDLRTAKKHLARAQHYLPQQPLTLMLSAQAARLDGNESKARLYLERMLSTDGGEFMATRGLIENARRNNDTVAAIDYAEKALAIKPDDNWVVTTLIGLYTSTGRSQQALQLALVSVRKRALSRTEARKLNAFILYESAQGLTHAGRDDAAISVLLEALDNNPAFIPASGLLAEAYFRSKQSKPALKTVAAAWKKMPHPVLSRALLSGWDASDEAQRNKIAKTGQKLGQIYPEHGESQYLLAEIALRQFNREAARGYIQHVLGTRPTLRGCRLMAELEQAEGNSAEAAVWLKRAEVAGNEGAYVCDACQHTGDEWHLTCPNCTAVASMRAR